MTIYRDKINPATASSSSSIFQKSVFSEKSFLCISNNTPSELPIAIIICIFESLCTVLDDTRPNRPHTARSVDNIAAVADSVVEHRDQSDPSRAKHVSLSYAITGVVDVFSVRWPYNLYLN